MLYYMATVVAFFFSVSSMCAQAGESSLEHKSIGVDTPSSSSPQENIVPNSAQHDTSRQERPAGVLVLVEDPEHKGERIELDLPLNIILVSLKERVRGAMHHLKDTDFHLVLSLSEDKGGDVVHASIARE